MLEPRRANRAFLARTVRYLAGESALFFAIGTGVPASNNAHEIARSIASEGRVVYVDNDPMIRPHYSHLLACLIPHAQVKIYPDSAHGFLFQHHAEFAGDVDAFLAGAALTAAVPSLGR